MTKQVNKLFILFIRFRKINQFKSHFNFFLIDQNNAFPYILTILLINFNGM